MVWGCFSGGAVVSVLAEWKKVLKILETWRQETKNLGIICGKPWGLRI